MVGQLSADRGASLHRQGRDLDIIIARGVPQRRFRPELHGVRGLAILGVVVFHLFGQGRVSGGIDIFLTISGFLFTAMLLREAVESGGRIDFLKYFGRLVRRILVPAVVVIFATVAAGLFFFPVTRHDQLLREARSSLLYFENIELISSQLAYGAAGPETSPFQHFWSLSVQGQFYLVWPLVTIIAVLVAKRLRVPAAGVLAVFIALILVSSFAFALYVGSYAQDEAYLMTRTRMWELAFGGLLGLLGGGLRLPKVLRFAAGWLGVGLIVSCGLVLDGAQLFPGPWALWPLLGLTLVLASAAPRGRDYDAPGSAAKFLSNKPLEWIGNYAYGLYLWHWPILIFFMEILHREKVGLRGATFILGVTAVLTVLMYHLVEQPLSKLSSPRSSSKLITAALTVFLVAGGWISAKLWIDSQQKTVLDHAAWDWENNPGAQVTLGEPRHELQEYPTNFTPQLEELNESKPEYYSWDCRQPGGNAPGSGKVLTCEDPAKPEPPTATVVLAGGSHAGQWYQAWRNLATTHGWELVVADKSGCRFGSTTPNEDSTCWEWNKNFPDWLASRQVDLVVAPGTNMNRTGKAEFIADEAPDRWQEIVDGGSEVLLMRGTPRPRQHVADCLASGEGIFACGALANQIAERNPLADIELPVGVSTIDMTPYICPTSLQVDGICPAVIGGVVLWYDNSHLTNEYVVTLAPILETHLRETVPWLFD